VQKSLFLALAGVMGIAVTATAWAQNAPGGNAANGKMLFEHVGCYQCHGFAGQGGAAGPKLVPALEFEPFALQLRMPRQLMPPYSPQALSDQQVADIHAFVKSLPGPVNRANVPLLQ
jgi:mono/diheme cytochrome c family protein